MSNVLNIDSDTIKNDSSPDNIKDWDSIKHMNLIFALEEEFLTTLAFIEKSDWFFV